MLPEASQKQGVATASAGNHALALSYHGQELGKKIVSIRFQFGMLDPMRNFLAK